MEYLQEYPQYFSVFASIWAINHSRTGFHWENGEMHPYLTIVSHIYIIYPCSPTTKPHAPSPLKRMCLRGFASIWAINHSRTGFHWENGEMHPYLTIVTHIYIIYPCSPTFNCYCQSQRESLSAELSAAEKRLPSLLSDARRRPYHVGWPAVCRGVGPTLSSSI